MNPSHIDVYGGAGSPLGSPLMNILMADEIQPGSDPSYQLCKEILTHHVLGQRLAQTPITMAQAEPREIVVQDAPEEVVAAFKKKWEQIQADALIHNCGTLARTYGVATLIVGCEDVPYDKPLEMTDIWKQRIWFSVLDPLNTAGSLVLNQIPTDPGFQKPEVVWSNGEKFHISRRIVAINEHPVYLSFTTSAWGFIGRSVYQRVLFPLKSYIRSMISNDMVQAKLGVLILKKRTLGSTLDGVMDRAMAGFRWLLKLATTGNVLSMGLDEDATTLNMQNVDGAGAYSRGNILKDIATGADMPAKLVANEELIEGFGEGTEDAKQIANYVASIRAWLQPLYTWMDHHVMYLAWTPELFEAIRNEHKELYKDRTFEEVFLEWKKSFQAIWPSLLREPESEQVNVAKTKFEALTSLAQLLLQTVDPQNKASVLQWITDNVNEEKKLFHTALELDTDTLAEYLENQDQQGGMPGMGGEPGEEMGAIPGMQGKGGLPAMKLPGTGKLQQKPPGKPQEAPEKPQRPKLSEVRRLPPPTQASG